MMVRSDAERAAAAANSEGRWKSAILHAAAKRASESERRKLGTYIYTYTCAMERGACNAGWMPTRSASGQAGKLAGRLRMNGTNV